MGGAYPRGAPFPRRTSTSSPTRTRRLLVLASRWDVTTVGLEATDPATADDEVVARIAEIGSPLSDS